MYLRLAFTAALGTAVVSGACSSSRNFDADGGSDANLADTGTDSLLNNPDVYISPPPGSACTLPTPACTTCTDFPSAPIIDAMPDDGSPPTPNDAATHFTVAPSTSNGPCILEPQDGTLIPENWLRPRFHYKPVSGAQTLFQIKLHIGNQQNDLVVYTTSKTYKLPATMWDAVRANSFDQPITFTVSAVDPTQSGMQPVSSSTTFTIAPAGADGSMIYWAATGEFNGQSWLEGFRPGDEGAIAVLDVSQVQFNQSRDQGGQLKGPQGGGTAGTVECIGCHTAIPDGQSVSFLDFWPWPGVASSVVDKQQGQLPTWLTPGGMQALNLPWIGIMSYSKNDWMTEKVAITTYGCDPTQQPWNGQTCSDGPNAALLWIDLASPAPYIDASSGWALGGAMFANEGTSYGVIARSGDTRGAAAPAWSHDGTTVTYVSTNAEKDGRLATGVADLWKVPFTARAGGTATAIAGASDPAYSEYYPSYGPDDKYLAFNHAPSAEDMYYNPHAEVFIVPAAGGTAQRLTANDPPACSGWTSPGVTNSWPKWAPTACVHGGKTYYWIIFSSSRGSALFPGSRLKSGASNVPTSQLYMTAVVDDGTTVTTTPALYIWNQPTVSGGFPQSNHTPVWEVVNIPPVPPPN